MVDNEGSVTEEEKEREGHQTEIIIVERMHLWVYDVCVGLRACVRACVCDCFFVLHGGEHEK